MKITRMTLLELSDAMQRGDLTSREVTQAYLDRIHQVEGKIQGVCRPERGRSAPAGG